MNKNVSTSARRKVYNAIKLIQVTNFYLSGNLTIILITKPDSEAQQLPLQPISQGTRVTK